jgi:hypothetical protein
VPDDGTNNGAVPAGTNYRFTQGNFDNIRLIGPKELIKPKPVEETPIDGGVVEPNEP